MKTRTKWNGTFHEKSDLPDEEDDDTRTMRETQELSDSLLLHFIKCKESFRARKLLIVVC